MNAKNLSLAVVTGLVLVTLCAAVLWLLEKYETALFVFTVGVAVTTLPALYAGRLFTKEARLLEERLSARDFRYRQTLELLPEGIAILGRSLEVEWLNSSALRYFGLSVPHVGESFLTVVGSPEFEKWLTRRDFNSNFILRSASGGSVLEVSAVSPDVRHTIVITRDITQKRALEEMRRDFVANVSHELRTPLTVIAGFLDYAEEDMPPAVRSRQVALMKEQTKRMQNLTDDLLMLAHLENKDDGSGEEPSMIVMDRLIDDVMAEAKALSAGRHEFHCRCEKIALIGFPDEIRSACMNLLSNAVRYTPEGGKITVEWKRKGLGAVFSVTDTGIGIEEIHIPRLTERFFRVDKSRARATGGTGLGLAIVKHVLRRNHGLLTIESVPGEGSVFAFVFPQTRIVSSLIG